MPKIEGKTLTKLGEGLTVFSAPSTSRQGMFHFVVVYPDERGITCTCEGWRYKSSCWHVEAVPLCMAKKEHLPWSDPRSDPMADINAAKSFTFNMTAIAECYYVEGHQGGHSWET